MCLLGCFYPEFLSWNVLCLLDWLFLVTILNIRKSNGVSCPGWSPESERQLAELPYSVQEWMVFFCNILSLWLAPSQPVPEPSENVVLNSWLPHRFGRAILSIYFVITQTSKIVFKTKNLKRSHLVLICFFRAQMHSELKLVEATLIYLYLC